MGSPVINEKIIFCLYCHEKKVCEKYRKTKLSKAGTPPPPTISNNCSQMCIVLLKMT